MVRQLAGCLVALLTAVSLAAAQATTDRLLSIETADSHINQAFGLARKSLEGHLACDSIQACAPVDAAIATWGLTAAGSFATVRAALAAEASRQRPDGSLAGSFTPDAVPAWLLAVQQYWNASGDDAFLERYWPQVIRAFRWSAAADRDQDGLVENAAAARPGAVADSLVVDIHLAALWTAALEGMQSIAHGAQDAQTRAAAAELATRAQASLEQEFWIDSAGIYGSTLVRSAQERTIRPALTPWPATAIWLGLLDADRCARMLERMGSAELTTDWGVRTLSRHDAAFDPRHYSSGAVLPFLTGITALAHYQHHRAWAAFDLVRDLANAPFDIEDGPAMPALLNGASYRSLAYWPREQHAANSMFLSAVVRGMLGWQTDAHNHAAVLEPHLPATWSTFNARNLAVGSERIDVAITRTAGNYSVNLRRVTEGRPITVRVAPALPPGARLERVVVNDADVAVHTEESAHDLHAVAEVQLLRDSEIQFHYGGGVEIVTPPRPLVPGDSSRHTRLLGFKREGREFIIDLEGAAGATDTLRLRSQSRIRAVAGSDAFEQVGHRVSVVVTLPAGVGFARKTLRVRS